ncbi:hypothetical protein HLB23_35910 [Nocardia uniformis]|uniref:Uncharacterized protein n=1 Tax=Nocardia uniformis TaxID=53432 RepID=A0A849CFA9_9NOCA|nr:hypothetical protein [Nocardia uniformis]NNH75177.1 hypothetical protein [Nocardia uniformis]
MKDPRWLDIPGNVTRLVYALAGIGVVLFLADLVYVKHPHFGVERVFGFYGLFGFGVSFALVLVAKQLRRVLRRDEDYYEPGDDDAR